VSERTASGLGRWREVARESGSLWACALAIDHVAPFGLQRLWRPRLVPVERLAEQVASVLRAWGMPDEQLPVTVEKILYADLRGIDSHGCTTLSFYQRLRAEGVLNPRATVSVTRQGDVTALVDGGGGLGHVPATLAMERAIEMAAAHGVGAVAVCNSGHFGAAGAYAAMAADKGFIGIATTSTPTPTVVPTFGRQAMLGTNPIAVAAPARRHPMFLLDMATSTASFGKVLEQWRKGRAIPDRWMLNQDGAPLTSGHAALTNQRLTPLGGDLAGASYKGYGLAMMVEILSAALAGVPFADPSLGRRPRVGHFVMALDPSRFSGSDSFATHVDALIDAMHDTEPLDPGRPVLVPGDPEQATLTERRARGVPLTRSVFEDLRDVARLSGVPFLLEPPRS
jgi:LDH2 family malate/lactate/ureidoglycolate dehydrogenase